MDVVALAQSGFGNAVATLGTACTAEHVQKLFRFTDSVVFSFDGDAAGRRAAGRALEAEPAARQRHAQRRASCSCRPSTTPTPTSANSAPRPSRRCIAQAVPLSRQLLEAAREGCDLDSAEGRARMLANATPAVGGAARRRAASASCSATWRTRRRGCRCRSSTRLWGRSGQAPATPAPSSGGRPGASSAARDARQPRGGQPARPRAVAAAAARRTVGRASTATHTICCAGQAAPYGALVRLARARAARAWPASARGALLDDAARQRAAGDRRRRRAVAHRANCTTRERRPTWRGRAVDRDATGCACRPSRTS